MTSKLFPAALALVGLAIFTTSDAQALAVRTYTATLHERFLPLSWPTAPAQNPSFIGAMHDFSGVGWVSGTSGMTVTLISPRHFLAAKHYKPGTGGTVCFRSRNGTVYSFKVGGYETTTSKGDTAFTGEITDVSIGYLTADIPSTAEIAWYPISAPSSAAANCGSSTLVVGQKGRFGLNRIVNTIGTFQFTRSYILAYTTEPSFTKAQSGDSGTPVFLVKDGKLVLLGHQHMIMAYVDWAATAVSCLQYFKTQIELRMAKLGHKPSYL